MSHPLTLLLILRTTCNYLMHPQQGIRAEPLLSMSCHSSCAAPSVHLIFPVIEIEEGQLVSFQLALAYLLLHLLHPFPYG